MANYVWRERMEQPKISVDPLCYGAGIMKHTFADVSARGLCFKTFLHSPGRCDRRAKNTAAKIIEMYLRIFSNKWLEWMSHLGHLYITERIGMLGIGKCFTWFKQIQYLQHLNKFYLFVVLKKLMLEIRKLFTGFKKMQCINVE